ncbi:MAG: hypothetical protein E7335_08220 [Clostridiales bacterium]|nr:hypothetical protein [Clostridiales bacterium]
MKAVIMAGGEGSRLRPITCSCPKPMVRFMDKPVLEYTLLLLKSHGIRDIGITLGYLPDHIKDAFGNGEEYDLSIRYFTEHFPLGTAGGVKLAEEMLDETFCVLSGDGITDIDLTKALEWHKSKKALATLILKHVENPLEYGVVVTNADGRVRSFHEKPDWGEVLSDTVNTGIYILEPAVLSRIPSGRVYDFGRDLFPELVRQKEAIYALPMEGYWCDIGDTGAYLRAHFDALDGKINLPISMRPGGVYRAKGAHVDRSAILEAPCFIGERAVINAGAHIGPYSIIGKGAVVEERSSIKRSVLWNDAQAQEGCQLRACILAGHARAEKDSSAFEESVLGEGATLGARAVLLPGVKVWPGKCIEEGFRVNENVVWGENNSVRFEGGAIPLFSPATALHAAQAFSAYSKAREVILGRTSDANASAYARAVCSGLMAQGVQVIDCGVCTLPQIRHTLLSSGTDAAIWVTGSHFYPINASGSFPGKNAQRSIITLLRRGDFASPFSGITHPVISAGRTDLFYIGHLANRPLPCECKVAVFAQTEPLMSIAERAFHRAGICARIEWEEEMMELAPDEIGIWLSETGEQVRFADTNGPLTDAENELLIAWVALESGAEKIIVPTGTTQAVYTLCEEYDVPAVSCKNTLADKMHAWIQENRFELHFDGIYASLRTIEMLSRGGWTLADWKKAMPPIHRSTRTIPVESRVKGRLLRSLAESVPEAELDDGIRIPADKGWIWISPSAEHAECTLVAEGINTEFADEICNFYADEIERILKNES